MFHTLLIQRLSFVLITLQVTSTFTCGMKFCYYNNHFTTIMQGCYNSARLRTPCTNCHNLVTTLSQPYKVAARLYSYFCMGRFVEKKRTKTYSHHYHVCQLILVLSQYILQSMQYLYKTYVHKLKMVKFIRKVKA